MFLNPSLYQSVDLWMIWLLLTWKEKSMKWKKEHFRLWNYHSSRLHLMYFLRCMVIYLIIRLELLDQKGIGFMRLEAEFISVMQLSHLDKEWTITEPNTRDSWTCILPVLSSGEVKDALAPRLLHRTQVDCESEAEFFAKNWESFYFVFFRNCNSFRRSIWSIERLILSPPLHFVLLSWVFEIWMFVRNWKLYREKIIDIRNFKNLKPF